MLSFIAFDLKINERDALVVVFPVSNESMTMEGNITLFFFIWIFVPKKYLPFLRHHFICPVSVDTQNNYNFFLTNRKTKQNVLVGNTHVCLLPMRFITLRTTTKKKTIHFIRVTTSERVQHRPYTTQIHTLFMLHFLSEFPKRIGIQHAWLLYIAFIFRFIFWEKGDDWPNFLISHWNFM